MVGESDSRSFELVTPAGAQAADGPGFDGPGADSLNAALFDPVLNPELFDGVTIRRMAAYAIDLAVIALLFLATMMSFWVLGMLSFGVLSPFLMAALPFIPLAYHTVLIGGPAHATLGMRLFGIAVRRLDGRPVGYLQAGLLTVVFYVSVGVTGWLILLVSLFNGQGRTFHDYLCGTLTIRPGPNRTHLKIEVAEPSR